MYQLKRGAYIRRVIRWDGWELLHLVATGLTTFKFRYLVRCVGKGTVVCPGTRIRNKSNVRIGRGCLLQDCVYIRAGTAGSIVLGDEAALNTRCSLFGHGGIEIGEKSQVGPGTVITTTDHDYENELRTRYDPVRIGRGVWIGANVTVLPGAEIGDGAVIGAGSVVRGSIPGQSVAVGAPARVVKTLDDAAGPEPTQRRAAVRRSRTRHHSEELPGDA